MKNRRPNLAFQYLISIGLITVIGLTSYLVIEPAGYKVVALILLLAVSVLAMLFDILPVLTTAVLSAIAWNFFFIPPVFTFHIGNTEDSLMFLMYFVVALINAALTFKIRDSEEKARNKEERENSIKLYNTLLNSLSHELRTPIATIIGAVDTIKENRDRLSEKNIEELITEIEIAGLRLNRQVENLLNMSRLESGFLKLRLDWCDINELIYTVIKNNQPDKKERNILFYANDNLSLFRIDRDLMEQAIQNVLHNALQYTPANATITIRAEKKKASCIITIEDNGQGIPEEKMQFIFDKFYRLPQTLTGGTGLGLSIAKGFIEAHQGKINVKNCKTGGAKFTIEIPAEGVSHENANDE